VKDVIVVGAGVTGSFIAKELSKYELDVAVLERKSGPGLDQTKGCSGIIHPLQLPFGSLKSRLCLKGNAMMDKEAEELGFTFERVGLILVATNFLTFLAVPLIQLYLKLNGVTSKRLSKKKVLEMVPNLREDIWGGLFLPTAGVVNPVEMTACAIRFAKANGVEFHYDCEVTGIERRKDGFVVKTTKGDFEAKCVINCAGLYADDIAKMVGYDMEITPGKGTHIVFEERGFSSHLVVAIPLKPNKRTKGGGALIGFDGKPIWGPNLIDVDSKDDTSVKKEEIEGIIAKFSPLFKRKPKGVVAFYAGLRSIAGRDFVINQPVDGFINVAGIQSPGLTAAPAIAEMVIGMLSSMFQLRRKRGVIKPEWKRVAVMGDEELEKMIKENQDYGEIVCFCNMVSKAEILRALEEGACFDAVRHLTWAGMDCCKCHADILKIIEEYEGKVKKEIDGSEMVW
jgi:glycerol-3-phosphate dehydrogenase